MTWCRIILLQVNGQVAHRRCRLLACPSIRQAPPNRRRHRSLAQDVPYTKLPVSPNLISSNSCQEVLANIRRITHCHCHCHSHSHSRLLVAMAYPFPRIALTPQTPQYVQGIESPRNKMSRRSQTSSVGGYRRAATIAAFLVAILLWLIYLSSSRSPKQADRVPFSPDHVEE